MIVFQRTYLYSGNERHNLTNDLLAATTLRLEVEVRTLPVQPGQPMRLSLTVTKAEPKPPKPEPDSD